MSSCIECRYAQARVASGDEPVLDCRRYPPAVIVLNGDPMTVWTQVDGDDLCGEWSPPSDPPIATRIGLNLDYHEARAAVQSVDGTWWYPQAPGCSMMFPPPDPASRWCRETPQAMRSASEIVRRVHLDVRRGHRGSV